ncbi:hypothetical protein LN458_19275 [Xanthomonas arboricola]|jgi:hypothetical protein|uniref:hypothetical protein n=1 Tax=Xanthomonas arboricola TaxID=56448 RepID=UPI001E508C52|nr:hypothetical protein [Xanthomonas arboricola]MCC8476126.1 hypothetical protein [Xanthomonas arboricola]
MKIEKIQASAIGVIPVLIRGMESNGRIYLTWAQSPVVGAQCANCNCIIWVKQRGNRHLDEGDSAAPAGNGVDYAKYRKEKILEFLSSMPPCPECGGGCFDNFVNNVNFPRFENGVAMDDNVSGNDLINLDEDLTKVFILE